MKKDKTGKTIRSKNYEVLSGRKPARHKNKDEKRVKDRLRREVEEY